MWPRIIVNQWSLWCHMGQSHGHLPSLPKSKRRMSRQWHLQFFLFKPLWFKLPSHIHFFVYGFLSLSLFVYMFIYVFHNELNIIVLRSICALLCLSQGVKHHCVEVHEKKQAQGQVEPKRFKLSWNRFFYLLSVFSTRRERMSSLKFCFIFFPSFFLF
jgi:hypothetical protein